MEKWVGVAIFINHHWWPYLAPILLDSLQLYCDFHWQIYVCPITYISDPVYCYRYVWHCHSTYYIYWHCNDKHISDQIYYIVRLLWVFPDICWQAFVCSRKDCMGKHGVLNQANLHLIYRYICFCFFYFTV